MADENPLAALSKDPDASANPLTTLMGSMPQMLDPAARYRAAAAAALAPTKTGTFGESFGNALAAFNTQKGTEAELQMKYLPLAYEAMLRKQQAEMAARQQGMVENFMRELQGVPPTGTVPTYAAGQQALGAAKAAGLPAGPTNAAAGAIPQMPAAQQAMQQPDAWHGADRRALMANLAFEGGKGVSDLLAKAAEPQLMDAGNGVIIDKRTLRPVFTSPKMSESGQASQAVYDPATGQWKIIAPEGAIDTYTRYQKASEGVKAENEVKEVYDPATGRMVFRTREQIRNAANGGNQPNNQPNVPAPASAPNPTPGNQNVPLAIRNNNPGNLRPGGQFAQYATPEEGLAALDKNLIAYGEKGINTLRGAINRWAPPNENNTDSYVKTVAQRLGIDPDQPIDLKSPYVRHALSAQIMLQESGPKAIFSTGAPQQKQSSAQQSTQEQALVQPTIPTPSGPMAAGPSESEKAKTAGDKAYMESTAKDTAEIRKGIMVADAAAPVKIAKLQQIGDLLSNYEGGKFSEKQLQLASAANSLGFKIDKNLGNKEAATALSRELALQLRDPSSGGGMPGSLSNSDRDYLTSIAPSMSQSSEGRRRLIDDNIALAKRNQQVADMARKYEDKYGRLDNNFFSQLQSWSNRNPVFGGGW